MQAFISLWEHNASCMAVSYNAFNRLHFKCFVISRFHCKIQNKLCASWRNLHCVANDRIQCLHHCYTQLTRTTTLAPFSTLPFIDGNSSKFIICPHIKILHDAWAYVMLTQDLVRLAHCFACNVCVTYIISYHKHVYSANKRRDTKCTRYQR